MLFFIKHKQTSKVSQTFLMEKSTQLVFLQECHEIRTFNYKKGIEKS